MSNDIVEIGYTLKISHKVIDGEYKSYITAIDYELVAHGASSLTLHISDPNLEFISDTGMYAKQQIVHFSIGQGNWEPNSFVGYISEVEVDFSEDGIPTMKVVCLDRMSAMNRDLRKKLWENTKISTVVKEIAKKYGFKTDTPKFSTIVDTKIVEESISQDEVTDVQFILSKAGEVSEEIIVFTGDDGYFYFRYRDRKASPVLTLQYKEFPYNIKSFNPTITRVKPPEDYLIKSKTKTEKSNDNEKNLKGYTIDEDTVITGSLSLTTNPDTIKLRPRNNVNIQGVGNVLSGSYFIEAVKMNLSNSGLSISIEVSKNPA